AVGTNKTITLSSGLSTFPFAANTFFVTDKNGSHATTQITCAYATGTSFSACSNVPSLASNAALSTGYVENVNTGTIGGWIKNEKQDTNGVWSDVTQTILNYGFGAPNLDGMGCSDPTPNAIIRLQRLRDNGNALLTQCPIGDSKNSYEWWPNVLY